MVLHQLMLRLQIVFPLKIPGKYTGHMAANS